MAMVAGETSGDLLAGLMMQGIRAQWPDAHLYGIGGPRMQSQGFEALWPSDKLAVRGYVEVLRHYREIVGIRQQLKVQLLAQKPQVFVGVDAPDFNLDLERDLKQAGIPTVHFVCPSIWAWRAASKRSNKVWIMSCASSHLKGSCFMRMALPPPMWAILWRRLFLCTSTC